MVYSTHPYLALHLPQNNPQNEHPVSFSALRSSSQCHFIRRRRPWPARGAKELLISSSRPPAWRRATKARPSEVSRFLALAWQRDQGQALATWLPMHGHCRPALGFSREIELHRLPEIPPHTIIPSASTADRGVAQGRVQALEPRQYPAARSSTSGSPNTPPRSRGTYCWSVVA